MSSPELVDTTYENTFLGFIGGTSYHRMQALTRLGHEVRAVNPINSSMKKPWPRFRKERN